MIHEQRTEKIWKEGMWLILNTSKALAWSDWSKPQTLSGYPTTRWRSETPSSERKPTSSPLNQTARRLLSKYISLIIFQKLNLTLSKEQNVFH